MRKLGVTISRRAGKAEPKRPKVIAMAIRHADFLSRYVAMSPADRTLHTLPVSREDLQRESIKLFDSIIEF